MTSTDLTSEYDQIYYMTQFWPKDSDYAKPLLGINFKFYLSKPKRVIICTFVTVSRFENTEREIKADFKIRSMNSALITLQVTLSKVDSAMQVQMASLYGKNNVLVNEIAWY